jgi:hypothetical protein
VNAAGEHPRPEGLSSKGSLIDFRGRGREVRYE